MRRAKKPPDAYDSQHSTLDIGMILDNSIRGKQESTVDSRQRVRRAKRPPDAYDSQHLTLNSKHRAGWVNGLETPEEASPPKAGKSRTVGDLEVPGSPPRTWMSGTIGVK